MPADTATATHAATIHTGLPTTIRTTTGIHITTTDRCNDTIHHTVTIGTHDRPIGIARTTDTAGKYSPHVQLRVMRN